MKSDKAPRPVSDRLSCRFDTLEPRYLMSATLGAPDGSDLVAEDEALAASVAAPLQNIIAAEAALAEPGIEADSASITGELKKWHKVTLDFNGPTLSETGTPNPFLDYRLDVLFAHQESGKQYLVPGYFAADGDAGNTHATSGNLWRVHFAPDETGEWAYTTSFRTGTEVAVAASTTAGTSAGFFDNEVGSFTIADTDKTGLDLRGKGRLNYVGEHYLQFAETGEYFLKQGPDAPENLFAYEDFDGGFKTDGQGDNFIKDWQPHVQDWNPGDPTWDSEDAGTTQDNGKGLIGAINYLASEGQNAFSFLTMNITGDDKNVFPYTTYNERVRLDVSRLDQWEKVLEHADHMGMYLHFKTQETENDQLLDGGALGTQRKLYYRELIARFSHHLALNWNLGEENTNTTQQRKDFAQFFYDNDPYHHHIVIHTYPGQQEQVYDPLLGNQSKLTGASVQTGQSDFRNVHGDALQWVTDSAAAGKKWVVAVDEPGDAQHALRPDNDAGNSHEDGRKNALWGTLLAGGAGNEWYFGYGHAHSDLTLNDFRSRDNWWDTTRYALEFFNDNDIPFWEMTNDNAISSAANDYGFVKPGDTYVVYLKNGGATNLDLTGESGQFKVSWYDPRNGGNLQQGSVTTVSGGGSVSLGTAPNATGQDWAILVERIEVLRGDYDNNGIVSQSDLDLVLLNWGVNTVSDGLPSGWVNDLPTVLIAQAQIDVVLLNWGMQATKQFAHQGETRTIADGRVIQFEHYDDGGEGAAYHDTTPSALGTPSRSEAVDGGPAAGAVGERVGWVEDGEWLEYTVDTTAGTYYASLRYAAGAADVGSVRLLLGDGPNGSNFTELGTFDLQNTGGWGTWNYLDLPGVTVGDGTGRVLRAEAIGSGFDLDLIEFSTTAPVNSPPTVTIDSVEEVVNTNDGMVYEEENGLVIMEAENTETTNLGLWNEVTNLANYTGDAILQFTGNGTASGPPTSPLEYRFKINQAGLYYLHLYASKDTTNGQPSDHSNDAYVRVDGDYNAGPNAGNNHGDDAPLSMLQSNTKFFVGGPDTLTWNSGNRLDPGGETNKRVAVYDFKAGEEYTLVVSGRSKYFYLDRIVFRHASVSNGVAQNTAAAESPQPGATANSIGYQIDATVTDDFRVNAPPDLLWAKVSGPGTVTFDDATAEDVFATFSVGGTYVLGLIANDGEHSVVETVTVNALSTPNDAPVVDAGPDASIRLPSNSVLLDGTVSDDNQPSGTVSSLWTVVSKPTGGAVSFGDNSAVDTTATFFGATGDYVLQLTADDGDKTTADQVTVTVRNEFDPLVFGATDDAYLENGNLFNDQYLKIENASRSRTSYLKFNVSGLDDFDITSAKVRLFVNGDPGSGTVTVNNASHSNWTESTLTDANKPLAGTLLGSVSGSHPEGQWREFDVSAAVTGNGVVSFVVDIAAGGNDVWFSSSEGVMPPELVIEATPTL